MTDKDSVLPSEPREAADNAACDLERRYNNASTEFCQKLCFVMLSWRQVLKHTKELPPRENAAKRQFYLNHALDVVAARLREGGGGPGTVLAHHDILAQARAGAAGGAAGGAATEVVQESVDDAKIWKAYYEIHVLESTRKAFEAWEILYEAYKEDATRDEVLKDLLEESRTETEELLVRDGLLDSTDEEDGDSHEDGDIQQPEDHVEEAGKDMHEAGQDMHEAAPAPPRRVKKKAELLPGFEWLVPVVPKRRPQPTDRYRPPKRGEQKHGDGKQH